MTALLSEAVALFGSICRKSTDALSDRDILIIDDDERVARGDAEKLTQQGWSVAKYSCRRLETLAMRRALFVQHLKLEARIIHDQRGRLRSVLENFQPAASYPDDIVQAQRLICLSENVPDSVQGLGWAFDVMAVGVRVLGIAHLANEGRYVFGFREIIDGLANINRVSKDDHYTLCRLRGFKSSYRKKDWAGIPDKEELFQVRRVIKRLGVDVDCNILAVDKMRSKATLTETANGYLALRAAEARYWGYSESGSADKLEFSSLKTRLAKALFRPQNYANEFKSVGGRFQKMLSRLEQISR